ARPARSRPLSRCRSLRVSRRASNTCSHYGRVHRQGSRPSSPQADDESAQLSAGGPSVWTHTTVPKRAQPRTRREGPPMAARTDFRNRDITDRDASNREKALDVALANIDKQFGKGSVMRLGDETRAPLEVIPTGAISLDIALGLGGLPRG